MSRLRDPLEEVGEEVGKHGGRLILCQPACCLAHGGTARRIPQLSAQLIAEGVSVDIIIGELDRSAGSGQQTGVGCLMIGRPKRIRNQDGLDRELGNLVHRPPAGAGAHDVRGGGLNQRFETRGLVRALVRETRYGVLLVQGDRNPQLRGGAHKGKLEVGTKSDGNIGHGELARAELLDQAVLFM